MLEPALLNETSEILSNNFSADEIDRIGKLLFADYSGHTVAGECSHITLSSGRAASLLVDFSNAKKKTFELIKLIIELDESTLNGKSVMIEGLEAYMNKLSKSGLFYDFNKRKFFNKKKDKAELINWGSLRDGKIYHFSVMSLDIVGNSKLVRKNGTAKMEKVYFHLRKFIEQKIHAYDGRIWSFAGDGGLIAFSFKGNEQRAALCALDIQSSMFVFNMRTDIPINDEIELRIGLDSGKFRFFMDTGHIVSDTINYASHLEKSGTVAGEVSISTRIKNELPRKISRCFVCKIEFEGLPAYTSSLNL